MKVNVQRYKYNVYIICYICMCVDVRSTRVRGYLNESKFD